MSKYRVETDNGTYEVELADAPKQGLFAGNDMLDSAQPAAYAGKLARTFVDGKFLDFMPQANIARRSLRPEDAAGHAQALAELGGIAPTYQYPAQTMLAGPGGAAMAAGANAAVGALNMFPNSLLDELYPIDAPKVQQPFKPAFEAPRSQTSTGRALDTATQGIGMVLPFALEKVNAAAGVQALLQKQDQLESTIKLMEANQARAGSVVSPMELTKPGATVKDVNATESAWTEMQNALLKQKRAVLDREHVAFDQQLFNDLRGHVIRSRKAASAWLKQQGEIWSGKFAAASEGKDIARPEAAQLLDGMAQHMGLVDSEGQLLKVNLTPSEARVMRLRNAYMGGGEAGEAAPALDAYGFGGPVAAPHPGASADSISLQKLYKELLGTKQLRGAPHVDDYALGQAKNYLADFLAQRGDADFVNLRSTYGPFAKFRDQIYKFIKPHAGTYNTDAAVNDMSELLNAASDIDPAKARNTGDLRAFLNEYRQVDPELSARLRLAERAKRDLNMAGAQMEAQTQKRIADKAPVFNELRKRAMETYDQTLQRYIRALQSAKTESERALASGRLSTFLRRFVLSPTAREIPRVMRLGAEFSAAGYIASRMLAGRVGREE